MTSETHKGGYEDWQRVGGAAAGGVGGAVVGVKAGVAAAAAVAPFLGPLAPLVGLVVAFGGTAAGAKIGYDKPEAGVLAGLGGVGADLAGDGVLFDPPGGS